MPRKRTVITGELMGGDKRRMKRRAGADNRIACSITHSYGRVYTDVWYDPNLNAYKLQFFITYEVGHDTYVDERYYGVIDGTEFIKSKLKELQKDKTE
jgi:hypothetical protein